jgi:hypothetical protein
MKEKERFSVSIDADSIAAIAALSAQSGLTKSFLVGRWIQEGLKNDVRLSTSERYYFSKKIIEEKLNMLYSTIGYSCNLKDIRNSVLVLYTIPHICFQSEKEHSLFKLSLYQILDDIQKHDSKLHEEIWICLKSLNLKVTKNSELSEGFIRSESSEDFIPSENSRTNNRYRDTSSDSGRI